MIGSLSRFARGEGTTALATVVLEQVYVELLVSHDERIAAAMHLEPVTFYRSPEQRDVTAQRGGRSRWRVPLPEILGQPLRGHGLVAGDEQSHEQGPAPGARNDDLTGFVPHTEGTQNPELQRRGAKQIPFRHAHRPERSQMLRRPLDADCTPLAPPDVTMSSRPGTAFRAQSAKRFIGFLYRLQPYRDRSDLLIHGNSWLRTFGATKERRTPHGDNSYRTPDMEKPAFRGRISVCPEHLSGGPASSGVPPSSTHVSAGCGTRGRRQRVGQWRSDIGGISAAAPLSDPCSRSASSGAHSQGVHHPTSELEGMTMPSLYGTIGIRKRSRLRRVVELIPIEVQVSALASILLISAFLSGFNWASSSGSPVNMLVNPSYEVASSNRSYVLECKGTPACALSESTAASWDVRDFDGGARTVWATTDRVPSTLGHGGRWMLHVTGSGGVGIDQAETFSVVDAEWSVWVFPVMGEVKACVGHVPDDRIVMQYHLWAGFLATTVRCLRGRTRARSRRSILHRGDRDLYVGHYSICGFLSGQRVGQRGLTMLIFILGVLGRSADRAIKHARASGLRSSRNPIVRRHFWRQSPTYRPS